MKLSITQGPIVRGASVGFSIPNNHCKELSNFLWEWYAKLPEIVSQYIDVVIVNPLNVPNGKRIAIKVLLSGTYLHTHGDSQETKEWKNEFVVHIFCYSPKCISILEREKDLGENLYTKLLSSFQKELNSYGSAVKILDHLVDTVKTHLA